MWLELALQVKVGKVSAAPANMPTPYSEGY